jgi:hypothetical protein
MARDVGHLNDPCGAVVDWHDLYARKPALARDAGKYV